MLLEPAQQSQCHTVSVRLVKQTTFVVDIRTGRGKSTGAVHRIARQSSGLLCLAVQTSSSITAVVVAQVWLRVARLQ